MTTRSQWRLMEKCPPHRVAAFCAKGDTNRAIEDDNGAIALAPENAALSERAGTYATKGDTAEAIQDLTRAISLGPKFTAALIMRGNLSRAKDDNDRAIADYTVPIRLDQDNALAADNRGVAYNADNDDDRAIIDYTRAIAIDARLCPSLVQSGGQLCPQKRLRPRHSGLCRCGETQSRLTARPAAVATACLAPKKRFDD